jgi:hypothetical protein
MRCGSPERYLVKSDGENRLLHLTGSLKNLRADIYACGACGYVERYVSAESLPLLRERCVRISPVD